MFGPDSLARRGGNAGKNDWGPRYNREVRNAALRRLIPSLLLCLVLSLAACNRGAQNNDAVRQGVIEHLNKVGLNVKGMDVTIAGVQFNGKQADATVSIAPKGNAGAGMSMRYHLEQQGANWVVTGRGQEPGAPHGSGSMPPAGGGMPGAGGTPGTNPHGGTMGAPGGSGKMPSPEDLPPAGQKK
jgi:hypothetical protein